jgi:cbb3-type cytochrome oxidase maturation protein
MYYPYFLSYMTIGLFISVVVFCWAVKNGQFSEQERARFLPLTDDESIPAQPISKLRRGETLALFFLACLGLLSSAAVLVYSLCFTP